MTISHYEVEFTIEYLRTEKDPEKEENIIDDLIDWWIDWAPQNGVKDPSCYGSIAPDDIMGWSRINFVGETQPDGTNLNIITYFLNRDNFDLGDYGFEFITNPIK